jgi:Ca2+-binding EF-hand superfamily protein
MGMYYPPEQMKTLFNAYDTDRSGLVDYKEFTAIIFGEEASNKALLQKTERVEPKT